MQRATLAEKEVTSLKEQLANHGGTGGVTGGGSSSSGTPTMAPPPPEREDSLISPHSQHNKNDCEVVAAKDKEVSEQYNFSVRKNTLTSLNTSKKETSCFFSHIFPKKITLYIFF